MSKKIFKILSTDELCICEGLDVSVFNGLASTTKHVRLIDPETYELTGVTRNVDTTDLVEFTLR